MPKPVRPRSSHPLEPLEHSIAALVVILSAVQEDTQDEPEINPKVVDPKSPKIQVTQAPGPRTSQSIFCWMLASQVAVDPEEPRTADAPVVQAKQVLGVNV